MSENTGIMEGERIEEWSLTFHGTLYTICMIYTDILLTLEVEDEESCDRWSAEFTSQYIEEVTHKAGNFKKFSLFVKMLSSAFSKSNESVFVDLLTFADLEILKARKTGQHSSSSNSSFRSQETQQSSQLKRYVILTYTSEFDRVHYPLPLAFEDQPNVPALRRTVQRLRQKLKGAASRADEPSNEREKELQRLLHALRGENTELKHRLRQQPSGASARASSSSKSSAALNASAASEGEPQGVAESNRRLRKQVEELSRQLLATSRALEQTKLDSNKQIARYKQLAYQTSPSSSSSPLKESRGTVGKEARLVAELQQRVVKLTQELKLERMARGLPSQQSPSAREMMRRPSPAPLPPAARRSLSAGSQRPAPQPYTPPPRAPPRSRSNSPSTYMQSTSSSLGRAGGPSRRYDSPLSTASHRSGSSRGSAASKGSRRGRSMGSERSGGSQKKKSSRQREEKGRRGDTQRSPSRLRGQQLPSPPSLPDKGERERKGSKGKGRAEGAADREREAAHSKKMKENAQSNNNHSAPKGVEAQGGAGGAGRRVLAMQSLMTPPPPAPVSSSTSTTNSANKEILAHSARPAQINNSHNVRREEKPSSSAPQSKRIEQGRVSHEVPKASAPVSEPPFPAASASSRGAVTSSTASAPSVAPAVEEADIQDLDKRIKALNQYLERARRGLGMKNDGDK